MTKVVPTASTRVPLPNDSLNPRILFEDPHLIVLSKPAGLLSQGEHHGDPNLVDWLRVYLKRNYVGLVHRLDRNTSGIMIVAKRTKSAQRLTDALQKGEIKRKYLAWLIGDLKAAKRWEHLLEKDSQKNLVRVVTSGGKNAALSVIPKGSGRWEQTQLTLAEFELETGRSHQIRVQAAYEGYPLLGDTKYTKKTSTFPRVALHSFSLEFPHPMSKEILKFQDPLPSDLAQISVY